MNLKSMKLIVPMLLLGNQVAFGQLAAKKDITQKQLYEYLNKLFAKNTSESKAEIIKEAGYLEKSKKEADQLLAARLYSNLDMADKGDAIKAGITKKFPKGLTVRNEAFKKLFDEPAQSADQKEKLFQALVKKFPETNFDEKKRGIYAYGMGMVAQEYAKEKNMDKVSHYLDLLKSRDNYISNLLLVVHELNNQKQYGFVVTILESIYSELKRQKTEGTKNNEDLPYFGSIGLEYAEALSGNNEGKKALDVLSFVHRDSPSEASVLAYTKVLKSEGQNLDAFKLLEGQAISNGKSSALMKEIMPLYTKLNNNLSDTTSYLQELDLRINEELLTKLKSEMVKNEAPQFSLTDREGKEVSLKSLKGKVVVLDFWATWCGPCKMSFPGMQAAVNKYANDKDVVFLFIDTWQKEANYKELVNNFIESNKYSFHVLFDEMKDTQKSAVSAYGVKGIPTKVVIDKEGFIRFQSSGGGADVEKIVNEISAKIELAKKG
ncbi:TlpA disulfide reductase family protein [Sphingobacterium sp. BIGb0165]|uniref:TlpA family protein disulfide reductase n=1 Tax=Sphingobacterium sp. BIGb0165 TaxID=2940615 RepID=UPI00216A858F|nr:TlpA disulfide reductase family protein [Sphingobacterium sp. BIGb0165]MCS4224657.1 thiol-disulfide isomerase/thioredoxin [Sphingobacterium sp. BIGb0165]